MKDPDDKPKGPDTSSEEEDLSVDDLFDLSKGYPPCNMD